MLRRVSISLLPSNAFSAQRDLIICRFFTVAFVFFFSFFSVLSVYWMLREIIVSLWTLWSAGLFEKKKKKKKKIIISS